VRLPLKKSLPTWPKNQKAMKKNTKIKKFGVTGGFFVGFCGDVKSVKSVTSVNLNFFLHSVCLFNLHFSFSFYF